MELYELADNDNETNFQCKGSPLGVKHSLYWWIVKYDELSRGWIDELMNVWILSPVVNFLLNFK